MSVVTKVLVVLLVLLSVIFSAVTIAFVAKTNDWRQLAEDYRMHAQVTDANQRHMAAAHAADLAASRDAIKDFRDRIHALGADLQDRIDELAVQSGIVAQLTADKTRADALAQRLTNELSIAQQARTALEEQRKQIETRGLDLERRNVDLNERVAELTTQLAVMKQQQRHLERQINEMQTVPGGGGLPGTDAPSAAAVTPSTRITGHVAAVDGNLVTISVGSADSVRSGVIFVVFRGNEYVGDIEISDVEPNLSAGRLIRSQAGMSPRRGDRVVDEYHLTVSP